MSWARLFLNKLVIRFSIETEKIYKTIYAEKSVATHPLSPNFTPLPPTLQLVTFTGVLIASNLHLCLFLIFSYILSPIDKLQSSLTVPLKLS